MKNFNILIIFLIAFLGFISAEEESTEKSRYDESHADDPERENAWKRKDVRDYNEADLEKLLEQWDSNDDDEDPFPQYDPYKHLDPSDQAAKYDIAKNMRTVMLMVTLNTVVKHEMEQLTTLWHTSLQNSHLVCSRFVTDDNVLFAFNEGEAAYQGLEYLLQQPETVEINAEGIVHKGYHYREKSDAEAEENMADAVEGAGDSVGVKEEL